MNPHYMMEILIDLISNRSMMIHSILILIFSETMKKQLPTIGMMKSIVFSKRDIFVSRISLKKSTLFSLNDMVSIQRMTLSAKKNI
jgi:hypothetical protein